MDKIKIVYRLLIGKHPERGGQTKNNKKIIKQLQHQQIWDRKFFTKVFFFFVLKTLCFLIIIDKKKNCEFEVPN